MDSRRSAGENLPERQFFPVSPSDPIYFHPPPNVSSTVSNFPLAGQFRMPFPMQGLPGFEGGFQPPRPAPMRPANFNEMLGERGGMPLFHDFTDSAIPSSQDTVQEAMEEDSQIPGGAADQTVREEDAPVRVRRRRQPATEDELLVVLMMMCCTFILVDLLMENEDLFEGEEEPAAAKRRKSGPDDAISESQSNIWPVAVQLLGCVASALSLQQGAWWTPSPGGVK
ncbi:hypothetical protein R1sor_012108 [Riccia sorocarpa]|uniref:Uncharacterized protein n=1 Tax=Riccia sorocarpa TaxID=122646 RepID=A0ABD3I5J8_9MARC